MKEKFLQFMHENYPDEPIIFNNQNLIVDKSLISLLYKFLKNKNNNIILTPDDIHIAPGPDLSSLTNDDNIFSSLDELVAVHITSVPIQNDTIVTQENAGLTKKMYFTDPSTGIDHYVSYPIGNDTIHFTLNCAVENHQFGNDWNSYQYGILIDFLKLDKEKVLDVKSEDTYLDGNANLNSEYFLVCPLGKRKELQEKNPKAIIIEYEGISLQMAMSLLIICSGKKLEHYGSYGWGRNSEYGIEDPDVFKLEQLVVNNDYPCLKGKFGYALHSETIYMARRMWKREYEALINLIEYNNRNHIDMPDNILYQVMLYGGAYSLPGSIEVSLEDYKKVVIPILQKHNYSVDDSIFENLETDKSMKLIYYSSSELPIVSSPSWEDELRNRIVQVIKNNLVKNNTNTK